MIKRGSTAGLHLHAPGAPSIATADLADVSACAPTSPAADEPVHLHPPGPAQAASGSISAAIEQRPWLALLCVVLVAGTVLTLGVGQRWCWSILSHCEAREPQPTASLRSVVGSQQRLQSSQRGDDARWRQATAGAAHPAAGGMATSSSFTVQRPQFLLFGECARVEPRAVAGGSAEQVALAARGARAPGRRTPTVIRTRETRRQLGSSMLADECPVGRAERGVLPCRLRQEAPAGQQRNVLVLACACGVPRARRRQHHGARLWAGRVGGRPGAPLPAQGAC